MAALLTYTGVHHSRGRPGSDSLRIGCSHTSGPEDAATTDTTSIADLDRERPFALTVVGVAVGSAPRWEVLAGPARSDRPTPDAAQAHADHTSRNLRKLAQLRARCTAPQPDDVLANTVAKLRAETSDDAQTAPDVASAADELHQALTPSRLRGNASALGDR